MTFSVDTDPSKLFFSSKAVKVQMKCLFYIPEFERAAQVRKITVYRFLISFLVPEL